MTEQELHALAQDTFRHGLLTPEEAQMLAGGYIGLRAERDALKEQLADARDWLRDAERAAAGKRCSCWLGRVGATSGSSVERQACAIHGDDAEVS